MSIPPDSWQDWAALVTIIQFVVVVFALIYAKGQLNEMARSRKLTATRELLDEVGSDKVREYRRLVLSDIFVIPEDPSAMGQKLWQAATGVAVAYDRVGYMVKQRLIPEKELYEFQRDEIELVWDRVKRLIEYVQVLPNCPRKHYCKDFKWLAEEWLPKKKDKWG